MKKRMFTKRMAAIMLALFTSFSLSAQTANDEARPKSLNIGVYKDQIQMQGHKNTLQARANREILVEEDFSLFTAGTEQNPDTSNVVIDPYSGNYNLNPELMHMPGWIGHFVYQAGGCAYFDDWYNAFIDTPEMNMTGSLHVSFKARIAHGNQQQAIVGICVNTVSPQPIAMAGAWLTTEWQTFDFDFNNNMTDPTFLQINVYSQWYLDDVVISRSQQSTPVPIALEATNYTMNGFDANWHEAVGVQNYLLTVCKREFYGPEEVYVEPESFESINNDGQWIDYNNPNFPEGWTIKLQEGNRRQVTTDAHSGNVALCLDAVGDTIIMPSNGGHFLSSNIHMRMLEYDPETDYTQLQFIAKRNGSWQRLGVYYMDDIIHQAFDGGWGTADMFVDVITNKYEEFGIVYTGEGNAVWAIDDWDYTTSQACNIETVIEDQVIPATTTSYTLSNLDPAYDYHYYLKGYSTQFGNSEASNYIYCFGLCSPILTQPSNITDNSYTANWEVHPKADAYEVHNYAVFTANTYTNNATVFTENFNFVYNGMGPDSPIADENIGNHRLDQYTYYKDWTGSGVILANGMMGAADNDYYYGRIYTPEIALNHATTFTVEGTVWGNANDRLSIIATTTGEENVVMFYETGFHTFNLEFETGPNSNRERLRIQTYRGEPFLLDNISVKQNLNAGDKYFGMLSWQRINDSEANSYTFNGLSSYGVQDFGFDVTAIHNAYGDEYSSRNTYIKEVFVPVSVDENSNDLFTVYPNPASEKIIFSQEAEQATVYDIKGAEVLTLGHVTEINTNMLTNGLYLIKIVDSNGNSIAKQVTIRH